MKEQDIRNLITKLKSCPLSDNKVDALEEELLSELSYGPHWHKSVSDAMVEIERLIKSSPTLEELSQEELPPEKVRQMNMWDQTFDDTCHIYIGRAKRWYKDYVEEYQAWGRTPKSFEEYVLLTNEDEIFSAITEEEIEILRDEYAMRYRSRLKVKDIYYKPEPTVRTVTGLEAFEGMYHIFFLGVDAYGHEDVDSDYGFPEASIPYLISLEDTTHPIKFGGEKVILLEKFYREHNPLKTLSLECDWWPKADFIRIWSKSRESIEDIKSDVFLKTKEGRKFAILNHIDINGLLERGLALNAVEEHIYD